MKTRTVFLPFAFIGTLWAAEVVTPANPQPDLVIAEAVLKAAVPADADDTERLQAALDEVGRKGGGTVFLHRGNYTITQPINVPVGVTLRGDCAFPSIAGKSTVIRIRAGRGDEDGTAAFTLNPGAGVMGLVFFYPDQTLADPQPYPWTVRTAIHPPVANDNQTVDSCVFVNSWKAISIGPEWNELHTIRKTNICALKTGLAIDSVTDIGRVIDTTISPLPWLWFGKQAKGAPTPDALAGWLLSHETTGVDFGRSDWEFMRGVDVRNYKTGIRFRKGVNGLSNAVLAGSAFQMCETALELVELNDVGLAVYDTSFNGRVKNVSYAPDFKSVVQFYNCAFKGAPETSGRHVIVRGKPPARRVGGILKARQPPCPKAKAFFDVKDYGASSRAEDNTAAFQKALDAAKAGGTVYVPAGRYRFRGNLRVPSGVELRGCTDVPHHTCSGGSVLMPYQGRNEEGGTPFISLEAKSGLRGLAFWYPEQTTINPSPYPWTVRSLGVGCWIRDVNIGNGWQGVDFATHPSDGHFITYLSGCCWRKALFVGKAKTGYVEDLQFNPHYSLRRAHRTPVAQNPPPPEGQPPAAGWEAGYLRDHLEGFVFRDCAGETIVGTFLYAAKDGIAFYGQNHVKLYIHGTDTGARGLVLDQKPGSTLDAVLAQIVPWDQGGHDEKAGIWTAPTDRGTATFHASQFWAGPKTMVQRGEGSLTLESLNSLSGPMAVYGGKVSIDGVRYERRRNQFVDVYGGAVKANEIDVRKVEKKED